MVSNDVGFYAQRLLDQRAGVLEATTAIVSEVTNRCEPDPLYLSEKLDLLRRRIADEKFFLEKLEKELAPYLGSNESGIAMLVMDSPDKVGQLHNLLERELGP